MGKHRPCKRKQACASNARSTEASFSHEPTKRLEKRRASTARPELLGCAANASEKRNETIKIYSTAQTTTRMCEQACGQAPALHRKQACASNARSTEASLSHEPTKRLEKRRASTARPELLGCALLDTSGTHRPDTPSGGRYHGRGGWRTSPIGFAYDFLQLVVQIEHTLRSPRVAVGPGCDTA